MDESMRLIQAVEELKGSINSLRDELVRKDVYTEARAADRAEVAAVREDVAALQETNKWLTRTLVASLLDMQRRRAGEGETADALASALARVESIARAHRHLYRGTAAPGEVDMATYIHELCSALEEALFLRGVGSTVLGLPVLWAMGYLKFVPRMLDGRVQLRPVARGTHDLRLVRGEGGRLGVVRHGAPQLRRAAASRSR